MRLTAIGEGVACVGQECTVPLDGDRTFKIAVEMVGPAQGYILAQSYINFGPVLTYLPSAMAIGEIVWPDCVSDTASRGGEAPPPGASAIPDVAFHGCLTGLLPPQPFSHFEGRLVEIAMRCTPGASRSEVALLPYRTIPAFPDPLFNSNGALFRFTQNTQRTPLPGGNIQFDVIPKLTNMTLNCGQGATSTPTITPTPTPTNTPGGPTETPRPTETPTPTSAELPTATPTATPTHTPTATPTPTPTPTKTPTPTRTPRFGCGDVNGDRVINALDALRILWYQTGMLPFIDRREADVNRDGVVDALDALFVLWIDSNLYRCR
jgi:hypothetical protein